MQGKRLKHGMCTLCKRTTHLTFHHLIPCKLHRRKHFRKHYSKAELNLGINLCKLCHSGLHKRFDEAMLARQLNTQQLLEANQYVQKHTAWVAKQKC